MNFINNKTPLFAVGGGIPAGGTEHAGHANFATLITPFSMKTLGNPLHQPPSDYADPMKEPIVEAPSVTWRSRAPGRKVLKIRKLPNGTFALAPENDTIEGENDYGGEVQTGPLKILTPLDDNVATDEIDSLVSGYFVGPDDPFVGMGNKEPIGSSKSTTPTSSGYSTPTEYKTASSGYTTPNSTPGELKDLPKPPKDINTELQKLQERLKVLVEDTEEARVEKTLADFKSLTKVKDITELNAMKQKLHNLVKDNPTFTEEQIKKYNAQADRIYESYFPFAKDLYINKQSGAFNNDWKKTTLPKIEKETKFKFLEKQTKAGVSTGLSKKTKPTVHKDITTSRAIAKVRRAIPKKLKPRSTTPASTAKTTPASSRRSSVSMEMDEKPDERMEQLASNVGGIKLETIKRKLSEFENKKKKQKIKGKPILKVATAGLTKSVGQNYYPKSMRKENKSKPVTEGLPEIKTRGQKRRATGNNVPRKSLKRK